MKILWISNSEISNLSKTACLEKIATPPHEWWDQNLDDKGADKIQRMNVSKTKTSPLW